MLDELANLVGYRITVDVVCSFNQGDLHVSSHIYPSIKFIGDVQCQHNLLGCRLLFKIAFLPKLTTLNSFRFSCDTMYEYFFESLHFLIS